MKEKMKGALIALGAMWSSGYRNATELAFEEEEWNINLTSIF